MNHWIRVAALLGMALTASAASPPSHPARSSLAPPSTRTPGGARDFDLGLDEVERMMTVRRWGPAKDRLLELLEEHRDASYVHAQATALRETLGRCALWERYPEPDPSKLIAGEVLDWDRKSGRVSVRYRGAVLPQQDFERIGVYTVHPLVFEGSYEVEARGRVPAADATGLARTPVVAVGVQPEEMLLVMTGHAPVRVGNQEAGIAPRILQMDETGATRVLSEGSASPAQAGAKYVLRVDVDGRGARATWNGRALVSWRSSKLKAGRVAVTDVPGLEELVLSGHADASWLARRVDVAAQALRSRFAREVRESEYVPDWLLAGPRRAPQPEEASAVNVDLDAYLAAVDGARAAGEGGGVAAEISALRSELAEHPDNELAHLRLVTRLLQTGRLPDARSAMETARGAGIDYDGLLAIEQLLVKAVRGPVWPRAWTARSRRYEVRSDVDQATCEEIAVTLEETTLALQRLLGSVAGLTRVSERSQVFVFSSPQGYRAYTDELGVRSPENAAGLYSPVLKQLLLLHLGDRDVLTATARHETVHLYLDARLDGCPTWLEEGLAEYFETLHLARGQVVDGDANAGHVRFLNAADFRWRPLADVVGLEQREFYADGARCYAQSWALVHYLARGEGASAGRLRALLADLAEGRSAAAAVERHLGELLPDLDARVRSHLAALR